ncbi:patatin-like phospholipase family protein [Burkholderia cenocepacia]|uniref:patatin-like phospholipase family protein n=1 Tax=Burkholderia cenocepacia TaxID=95486 RepID=UPI0009B2A1AF|nr:patatin-like phospholipase family protein [Burkholderia cenocepacia]MBR7979212.1 patatin-like phospholipase family protein [Burkholderia cenocepacia]
MAAGAIFPKTLTSRFDSTRFSSRVDCALRRSSACGKLSCHSKYRATSASTVPGSIAFPLSGEALREYLTGVTGGKTFAELDIDLKVIATDLLSEREFQFSRETTPEVPVALAARASASIPIVFAQVAVAGGLFVDGGMCDNMPVSDLTVDDVPRVGIFLESDDLPLMPGTYGIATLAPRMIDVMLASNEESHCALDQLTGATFVRVPTGYASSFDRHMPVATRQRLYDDGYKVTAAALETQLVPA